MSEPTKRPEDNRQSRLAEASETSDAEKRVTARTQTTLTQSQKAIISMQNDVIKFVTKMLGAEKAKEFATRVALIARDNPKLAIAIERNPESFLTAYMASAERDLMPNTSKGLAYLIPYGDKVQFQVGYQGLLLEARRTGEVMTIDGENVIRGDYFKHTLGTERKLEHEPGDDLDRTKYENISHAYATAKLTNGEHVFVVMTKKELDKVKATAKSSSTDAPWQTWPERQTIKTVYKRLAKVLPSERMQRTAALDDLAEAGKLKFDRETGEFIEGEVALAATIRRKIEEAKTTGELQAIMDSLSPQDKKLAQPLVEDKFAEL